MQGVVFTACVVFSFSLHTTVVTTWMLWWTLKDLWLYHWKNPLYNPHSVAAAAAAAACHLLAALPLTPSLQTVPYWACCRSSLPHPDKLDSCTCSCCQHQRCCRPYCCSKQQEVGARGWRGGGVEGGEWGQGLCRQGMDSLCWVAVSMRAKGWCMKYGHKVFALNFGVSITCRHTRHICIWHVFVEILHWETHVYIEKQG